MADPRPPSPGRSSRWAPYPKYKDSGVEGLGEIPAHWEAKKWRYCCRVAEGGQIAPDEEQYRDRVLIAPDHVEPGTGRILRMETAHDQGAISGKYLVKPGDIIYSKIRPALNKACVSTGNWLCSADMYPVSITDSRLETRFLLYFILSGPFVRLMVDESMRVAMPKVNREKLAAVRILIPDPVEQRAIVDFLDRETAKIDALVAKQQRLVDVLEEKRTALITQALTRGLDPNVPMRSSGVEWLGEIPAHWDVQKLRRCVAVTGGMTPSMEVEAYWNGSIPWVTPKDMKAEVIGDSGIRVTEAAVQETSLAVVESGAVLMVVRGMILAKTVPVAWTKCRVTINQDMKALRPVSGINEQFLARALAARQEALLSLVDVAGHGSRRLPTDRWLAMPLPIPPRAEQEVIVNHTQESTAALAAAAEKARASTELLREYRTSLMTAAVTGSIDVRDLGEEAGRPDVPGVWM